MPAAVTSADFDAVLFDLDGVLTTTRAVHAAAWKDTFDDVVARWDAEHGTTTAPFDSLHDYAAYVDGRPRQEGARAFLLARGISLPEGTADSPEDEESVWGVANRKQAMVESELERVGVEPFPGSVAWVRQLREAGLRTAVVSASRNCETVLEYAGIATLFDTVVDGGTALREGLVGKPAPDTFLEAARRLGVEPARAVVVEDAIAGVQAGRAGSFGLVIAVDRDGHGTALAEAGADLVVNDLSEMLAASTEPNRRAGPREHRLIAAAARILATTTDYPPDPWRLVERAYNPDFTEQTETLFALSNGYLGIRASFEEGAPRFHPDTLVNGFHETWPIVYPERAHGFAQIGQTIVPVPDGTAVRLFVDDDPVTCENTEVLEFERALDMHKGLLERSVVFQFTDGRRFWVRTERFVSNAHRHLACLRYQVTALDADGVLTLSSELVTPSEEQQADGVHDPRRSRSMRDGVLHLEDERVEGTRAVRTYRTEHSGLAVAAAMDHDVSTQDVQYRETHADDGRVRVVFDVNARVGATVTLVKWLAYHTGPDSAEELRSRATSTLDRARNAGYQAQRAAHTDAMAAFWDRTDILWEGAPAAQSAIRYSLFTVWQAASRSEGYGVPAKGLSGTGYEGHYFWDTEVYVLPMLVHTSPDVARALLMHRVRMLDDARRRAVEVGCSGALFPWRTINGEEASAYYAAGTAQYHINADVAYALDQYVRMTGDTDLLVRHGAELLVETARMWADLGYHSPRHDAFVIQKVTGPDEYTTVVDNNLFTNLMAAENMRMAADAVHRLRSDHPADYRRLVERTGLQESEPPAWRRAAARIHVPYDDEAQVHLQDEGFLDLEPWDFAGTPPEDYPLLLHYHPLVIYRHQVIKQADVVLATVLLPERFSREDRERIFAYYDPMTTGDSSLSESIQSVAAAAIGKYRSAEEYLIDAMAVDMADTAGNVRDGVHVASAGGAWMAVVLGFAGFRWRGEEIELSPMLPTRSRRVRFPLRVRGSLLEVDIEPDRVTYALREGEPLRARHHGEPFTVAVDAPVSFAGEFQTHDAAPVDETDATAVGV